MFDITGSEVLMIMLVALFVLGPERLPEVAKTAGQAYSKLKKMVSGLQSEMQDVMDDPAMKPLREVSEFVAQPRKKLSDLAREADKALSADSTAADTTEKPKNKSAMDDSAASTYDVDSTGGSESADGETSSE